MALRCAHHWQLHLQLSVLGVSENGAAQLRHHEWVSGGADWGGEKKAPKPMGQCSRFTTSGKFGIAGVRRHLSINIKFLMHPQVPAVKTKFIRACGKNANGDIGAFAVLLH